MNNFIAFNNIINAYFLPSAIMIIDASNILLPMLFNLLLANITILLCFFFFFMLFLTIFFHNPVEIKNARLKNVLSIPTGAPITVANDAIKMLPLVADKKLKIYQNSQKKQYIY